MRIMTEAEQKRVQYHLDVPVCRLLSGIKRHIELIGMDDLSLLCQAMSCSVGEVAEVMYRKKRKYSPEESWGILTIELW